MTIAVRAQFYDCSGKVIFLSQELAVQERERADRAASELEALRDRLP